MAVWGDYDNDGDLDAFLTGYSSAGEITALYRNSGGTFADSGAIPTGLGLGGSAADWGDYDNDGDLDIALIGRSAYQREVRRCPSQRCRRLHRDRRWSISPGLGLCCLGRLRQ